jgi:hypothetical protein
MEMCRRTSVVKAGSLVAQNWTAKTSSLVAQNSSAKNDSLMNQKLSMQSNPMAGAEIINAHKLVLTQKSLTRIESLQT